MCVHRSLQRGSRLCLSCCRMRWEACSLQERGWGLHSPQTSQARAPSPQAGIRTTPFLDGLAGIRNARNGPSCCAGPQAPLRAPPAFPCSCRFKAGVRGTAAGQVERGSCLPSLLPHCRPHHCDVWLPCPPERARWSGSRLPSAPPLPLHCRGGDDPSLQRRTWPRLLFSSLSHVALVALHTLPSPQELRTASSSFPKPWVSLDTG